MLLKGLPYALALMTILGIHEMALPDGSVLQNSFDAALLYPPCPFLGTFGAFIQMRSLVPNRKALFDLSIAGPLAGFGDVASSDLGFSILLSFRCLPSQGC